MRLTRHMLEQMQRVTGAAAISSVVNTHANGDHCWGNAALAQNVRKTPTSASGCLAMGNKRCLSSLMAPFFDIPPESMT